MKKIFTILLVVLGVGLLNYSFAQKTWDGGGDGYSWNSAMNWNDDMVPTASDDVHLNTAVTVYVYNSDAICNNLTITNNADLQIGFTGFTNKTLIVEGDLDVKATTPPPPVPISGGKLTIGTGSTLIIKGGFIPNGTITLDANSSINYGGTSQNVLALANGYQNLILSGSGSKIAVGSIDIKGSFSVTESATLDATTNATTFTFSGTSNQTISGGDFYNLTISDRTGTVTFGGDISISNTFSAATANITYAAGTSTVTFNGSAAQTVPTIPYYNLEIDNSAGAAMNNDLSVTGDLNLTSGTLTIGQNTLTIYGDILSTSGSLAGGSSSYLNLFDNAGTPASANISTITVDNLTINRPGKSVTISGTVEVLNILTITAGTLNGGAATDNLIVNKDFINNGIFDPGNGIISFDNSVNLSNSSSGSFTFNDVLFQGTFATVSGKDFTVGGNWTNQSTSSTLQNSVTFIGSGQQITADNQTFLTNITFSASGDVELMSDLKVNGNVDLTSGNLRPGTNTITLAGNWNHTGGTFDASTASTILFNGSAGQTISCMEGLNFYNLELSPSMNEVITLNDPLDLEGNLIINIRATFNAGTFPITLAGDWINGGGSFSTSSTVTFDGIDQIINPSNFTIFNQIMIAGTGTKTLQNNLVCSSLNIGTNSAFSQGTYQVTVNDLTSDGILIANTGILDINGILNITGGTFNASSSSTNLAGNFLNEGTFNANGGIFNFDGTTTISGSSYPTFNDIIISGTLNGHATQFSVAGNFTNNGTFNHNNGLVIFSGSDPEDITGEVSFYDLTLNKSNSLTLDNNNNTSVINTLTLSSGTINTSNTLVLVSNASGTARIAPVPSSGVNLNGNVTLQRYVGGGKAAGWYNLGVNVSGLTLSGWQDDFWVQSGTTNSNVQYWDEPADKFTGVSSLSSSLSLGRGYRAYLYPDQINSGAFSFDNYGTPVIGNYTINLNYTPGGAYQGWNFVANVYPSAVNWDNSGWTKTNINNSIHIWNATSRVYAAYVPGGIPVSINGGTAEIASGQGFWVQANGGGASLTFSESVKSSAQPTFFRKTKGGPEERLRIAIEDPKGNKDEAVIRFREEATFEFDSEYDAAKLKNTYLNVASLTDDKEYAVNSLPLLNQDLEVPLSTTYTTEGNFTFTFTGIESFITHELIYLHDNYLNETIALNEQTLIHSFVVNSDPASKSSTRFRLTFEEKINLYLDSVSVAQDQIVKIPVRVNNFKELIGMQFSVNWDPALIEFVSIENFPESLWNNNNVNLADASQGIITFLWDEPTLNPVSLPDSSILFVLEFKALADKGTTNYINISGDPVPIEFVNQQIEAISYSISNGKIYVLKSFTVNGSLRSAKDYPINKAKLIISGNQVDTVSIDENALFNIFLTEGGNYELSVSKDEPNFRDGITALDIIHIRRHILGIEALEEKFSQFAADVDQSGSISTIDILWLRKLILGLIEEFPNTEFWKFIPYTANELNNVKLHNISEDTTINFIGFKLGDVNYSQDQENLRKRNVFDELTVYADTIVNKDLGVIEVPVKIRNYKELLAFQFTFAWDSDELELIKIENGDLNANFGLNWKQNGKLTSLWDSPDGEPINTRNSAVVFIAHFKLKKQDFNTKSFLINSEITQALAYTASNEEMEVIFENDINYLQKYRLEQNQPNPFKGTTNIKFHNLQEGKYNMTITDLTGKIVDTKIFYLDSGYQVINYKNNNLNSGVFIYTIEGNGFKESKRMVVE